jgi:hypothetical protein
MRIEFLNPSTELIGLLASLEEFLIGEIVVTDAIHVEAVTPRAMNLVQLLKDPIFKHPAAPVGTDVHVISDKDNIDPTVDHDEQFRIAAKSELDAASNDH